MEKTLFRRPEETADAYLLRIGSLKNSGILPYTWSQLAMILNTEVQELAHPLDESTWRKKYQALNLQATYNVEPDLKENELQNISNEEYMNNVDMDAFEDSKETIRLRDERHALNRIVRSEARKDAILDLFKSSIQRYDKTTPPVYAEVEDKERAIYALLSDIHYGIEFTSSAGKYSSDIARFRVLDYARRIAQIGMEQHAQDCYVSLLGDMISGVIHAPIRIENRENAVEQVVGVSELVSDFLYILSCSFRTVYVNAVSGNHSRIEVIADNSLRAEKLDALVPWYCKAKLENVSNVIFVDNTIDNTICSFCIYEKNYVGVHGDYDKDLAKTAMNVERLMRDPVDYIVAGHLHVPNVTLNDRGYIRNGSVCGSGDDYTMRNRLFGSPYQLCMAVTEDGIESIWPIALQ